MILRYSSLETLLDCPRKFYKGYVQGLEEKPSYAKDIGTALHAVLQRWHEDPFLDIDEECREEVKKYETLIQNYDDALKDILIMARTFVKYFEPELADVRLEDTLKVQLGQNGHIITGTPDYLALLDEDNARLIDYKTGRLKRDTMQLKVYAWLASEKHGFKRCRAELWYLRDADIKVQHFGPNEFQEAKDWVKECLKELDERLSQGEQGFPPRPNRFCSYCTYAVDCPAAEPADKKIKDMTNEELAQECLAVEARYKALQDELKKRVKENGAVAVNGVVYDFYRSAPSKTVTDMEKYLKIIKENHLKLEDYLQPAATNLKKLLGKDGWQEKLGHIITEKPGKNSFKWKPEENIE